MKTTENAPTTINPMVIDLNTIPSNELPNWLRVNGRYFCFAECYASIEETHRIKDMALIDSIESGYPVYNGITLENLKTKIDTAQGDYNTYTYDYYMLMYFDAIGQIQVTMTDRFDAGRSCYSVPLLRAVVGINRLDNSSIFEFATVRIHAVDTIIFRVKAAGHSTYTYYDFSNEPK
ncbi:MAG TPA: hypothetical protein VGB50_00335 [Flavobacterium sp.]|jgi:hypothetical protein